MVGNLLVVSVDVVFSNGSVIPTSIRIESPANSQKTSVVTFEVSVNAPIGVKNVTITVFGPTALMVFNAMTGHYELRTETGNVAPGSS